MIAPAVADQPATLEELRDVVGDAATARRALRIAGTGTWLDAGREVRGATPLSLAKLRGIVDYVPGDLTLTALAGTPLDEIERATAGERQWLALDPMGGGGTLGATIATASAGPLAHFFGAPRDNVLGLAFVTGDGALARGGGRVVKNVAGFDLVRLLVGSWGTLGVVGEVTVRLRALPEIDETVALPLPGDRAARGALIERLRLAPLAPWSLELLDASLAARLDLPPQDVALLRLAGNASLVRGERATLAAIGDALTVSPNVWRALRLADPPRAAVVRISDWPSRVAPLWEAVRRTIAGARAHAHATVGRGIVRCVIESEDGALLRALGTLGHARVWERLPTAALWDELAPPVADRLTMRIRRAYDPHGILNPGLMGAA